MSGAAAPFSPRAILAVLAVGVAAFALLLYALGAGWDGGDEGTGPAHAAADGLNGYSGLVALLERQGQPVTVSRSEAGLDDRALLVLTPPHAAEPEALAAIIAQRRTYGPTLVILPKWSALPAEQMPRVDAPRGWVMLVGASAPEWVGDLPGFAGAELEIVQRRGWEGMALSGRLPRPSRVMGFTGAVSSLVRDDAGQALAAFAEDDGEEGAWPVLVVAEPDLMNNYGLADLQRARAALAIVDSAMEGADLPIVFDMTVVGLARGRNLLTLAFEPPFLAATLCLALAALVVAWRAFRQFGPPVAEAAALALGKRQLAANGAGLIERAGRLHLLGPPYAALLSGRIAALLGIRDGHPETRDDAAARAIEARGLASDYPARIAALRSARRPHDLIRAAAALKSIERTLAP